MAQKYGADTLCAIMDEVLDYSERMMRAALLRLPDGEAEARDPALLREDVADGYVSEAAAR